MTSIIRTLVVASASLVPNLVSAAYTTVTTSYSTGWVPNFTGSGVGLCGASGIGCIGATIIYLINSVLVPLLFAVAFIVFLYGIAKAYIFSHGDQEAVSGGHKLILWGLIGFVVMISLWGLVNVVANTFGLSGDIAPTPPTSR